MGRVSKDAVLKGGDLVTQEVEWTDGNTVLVRSLPAAYANRAESQALVMSQHGDTQTASIDSERLEILKFAHGVQEPEFSEDESAKVAEQYGSAFKRVIKVINEISGLDEDDAKATEARFPASGDS